ncbi:MAG: hypothetical protein JWN31_931 [Frankiales bacterium]|nr:hypothetical protein [Frankiales bacterium]
MKRPALIVPLVLAALVAAFLLGGGRGGNAVAASTPDPGQRGVVVDGSGDASGAPDVLRLTLGVQADGADVSTALNRASAQVAQIRAALARHHAKAEDIQTSDVSIYPTEVKKARRYQVSEQLTAKLRNLGEAGRAISDAVSAGGNGTTLAGVSFALEDNAALLDNARDKAFADARRKAERYATLSSLSLGAVQLVAETVDSPPVPFYAKDSAGAGAADSPVPLYQGESQVSVRVTVRWALS